MTVEPLTPEQLAAIDRRSRDLYEELWQVIAPWMDESKTDAISFKLAMTMMSLAMANVIHRIAKLGAHKEWTEEMLESYMLTQLTYPFNSKQEGPMQ